MELGGDSEEPSDGEEFYENDDDKEDNEAHEVHQPKLPGGIPRPPNPADVKPAEAYDAALDAANRSARGSEFRIKHNISKGSLGATAGSSTYQNPAKKTLRPSLIGMNKPQMLKHQNDDIKRMLGLNDGQDPEKAGGEARAERKVGPGTRLQPVVRQNSATRQGRGKLPSIDQESLAGTPASKKQTATMRASSTSKFSASMSNMS